MNMEDTKEFENISNTRTNKVYDNYKADNNDIVSPESRSGKITSASQLYIDILKDNKAKKEVIKLYIGVISTLLLAITYMKILNIALDNNQNAFVIDDETMKFINFSFNASILLIIPFLLGILGALARILISGFEIIKSIALIIASGLMGVFSWVSMKSGLLMAIITPRLVKQGFEIEKTGEISQSNFYTMALISILVGMFSSNVYILINQRVEQLANAKTKEEKKGMTP